MFDEITINQLAHKLADIIIEKTADNRRPAISPKYVTFEDAGVIMGNMTENAVREMVKAGKLRRRVIDGRVWIATADIDRIMDEEIVQPSVNAK
jgi:hypothetical protein